MFVKCISLPSFPIGCLTLTACCDSVLSLVDIDFLVRVVHFPKCTKIKGTCSYIRPNDGPRGPKHVACGYFIKGCR